MKLILLVFSLLLFLLVFTKLIKVQMNNVPELGRFVYEGALWKMPISHWNINQTTEVQEGMEPTSAVHNSWSDLWTDLKTRTSQYQLSKFFESDMKVEQKQKATVDKKTELTLKDMVFKASSNSAINDNGEPSTEQLRTVLLDGYRFIDLHVYMISSNSGNALYVANPAEPSRTTISASLPLSKALEVIQETAFSKPNNYKPTVDYDYTQDPLFIHFVLHKHPNIRGADMLDLLYKNYLDPREGKGLIPTQFWHMVQSTQTAIPIDRNTSFGDIKRKALFGFNVQNLVQLYSLNENADDVPVSQRRMLMNMCNFKTGGHSWNAYTSYNGLPVVQTNISENGMSTNAKQMNIVLPPPTTQQNPDVYRVLEQNQIQTVPVLVHLRDEGVDLVRELHNECKTSCIPYSTALARAAIANKNT